MEKYYTYKYIIEYYKRKSSFNRLSKSDKKNLRANFILLLGISAHVSSSRIISISNNDIDKFQIILRIKFTIL